MPQGISRVFGLVSKLTLCSIQCGMNYVILMKAFNVSATLNLETHYFSEGYSELSHAS